MKKIISLPAAILLVIVLAGTALASPYEEVKIHGSVLTDQVNQVRSPNLDKKYMLYKYADIRSQERADERDRTGTSEFSHDLDRFMDYLNARDICYNWVGEVLGYSNQLRESPDAATADDMVDRWEDSPSHNEVIKATRADWGGGGWVRSESGTYFFAFYVVDVCGV
jgi:uncharacterized protein YkwD